MYTHRMTKTERITLKEKAKAQIKGHIGVLFAVTIIVAAITAALNTTTVDIEDVWKKIPTMVVSILVTPAFLLGTIYVYIDLVGNKEVKATRVFDGFNSYGRAILLALLQGVFTFLWALLLIVPGIIKAISYSQGMYLIATHPEMSASEAMNESKRMMQGHKWEYFVLILSFIWWGLLFVVSCGIASIYVTPYFQATLTDYYYDLYAKTHEEKKAEPAPAPQA